MGALLTPDEVARRLGVSAEETRRKLRRKELPGGKVGRQWRVDADLLERWIRERMAGR